MPTRQSQPGLEVSPQHSDLEHNPHATTYPGQGPHSYDHYALNDKAMNGHIGIAGISPDRQICGLSRKTFTILVAAAIIIITAAALGGGLGGGLSAKKNATASPQQTSTISPSGTSPASASTSTASSSANSAVTAEVGTVGGSTVTLYRDCPSTNNSLYSIQYSSTTYQFRKMCNMQFANNVQYKDWVSSQASSLNDCVNLCAAWNENNVTKGTANQVCSAVCWRYGFLDDDLPGQCFGYTTSNVSSGGFNVNYDGLCDAAAWINQT